MTGPSRPPGWPYGQSSDQPFRRPDGGRVDRSTTLSFTFDGRDYTGHPGDTLASALLANGVRTVARGVDLRRPRGVYAAGAEEPCALVAVESGPAAAPMARATQVELYDGLSARGLAGRGIATDGSRDGSARHDRAYLHCDVLVVGGGPTGLAAARAAGATGARVVGCDAGPEHSGGMLGSRTSLDGEPAAEWVERIATELGALPEVRVMPRTTAVGYYDHNEVVAVERRTGGGQRLWHFRARQVVLATGAHERPIVFTDNDRPGVMLVSAARTYVNRYGVLPGRRAAVFTANDSAYAAALDLLDAGVEVAVVVDVRPEPAGPLGERAAELRRREVEVLRGHVVVGTDGFDETDVSGGTGELRAVRVAPYDAAGAADVRVRSVECDLLAVSGGWNPAVHLFSQSQGRLRYDETLAAFVPDISAQAERSAGAARGVFGTAEAISDGFAAGAEAARLAGFAAPDRETGLTEPFVPRDEAPAEEACAAYWAVPARDPADAARQFVDLERDATVADVERATGTGMRAVEHVKRYTTVGTASDQGKTSGVVTVGVVSELLGQPVGTTGTTTYRPPYVPVPFALLAGRDRGVLADPARVTAIHDRHVAAGAVFEDVGQWKRPWYFPGSGENLESAVLRECRAARESVAAMDASTLGKIDIQGPDAAAFLDRVYTNRMSTLRIGACRYGLMCSADGMVLDDGVAARLGDDRFVCTTTTGNAAAVLDWLEEWLQTEWPDLRVWCTSVTDHWATVAIVGPRARDVLAALAPELSVDAESFPFMTFRDAMLDNGVARIAARVFRVSFSGELAYEVNVPWWYGQALWEAVMAAGEPYGITPYGTETMHVLRAEKGYAIVGQETDGTVTPQDLGMDWIVSKKKGDFVGRRSHRRPDTARGDRARLVGLLPDDPADVVPEGAQLVETPGEPPVPMVGHVTSSYRSAALGRSFALALVHGGLERVGERLYAPLPDRTIPVIVTEPVFYDPGGTRRDGPDGWSIDPDLADEWSIHRDRRTDEWTIHPDLADEWTIHRESPAEGFADRFAAAGRDGTARLAERPFLSMIDVRVDPRDEAALTRLEESLALPVPRTPCTASGDADRSVLWMGPDWWLVVGQPGTEDETGGRLRDALGTTPGSVVDTSAQCTALELSGPRARDVLMTGCRIDLHPRAFPPGAGVQTLLAKAQVVVHHLGGDAGTVPTYRILVRASFAAYLAEWLLDAMTEHT